ncbi:low-density lipoprotein receptor class A domain-containing protein 2 isoform X2 [Cyprinodon tularosa]|uniref:low-density lipoprotein receptor class A domain-containing protein 2 isoform X2 n=1 Tax=Cyprinodon tularosa TaxID=77115 RepID=UPI0018E22E4A|nr:low-density lipoprotein receptor class A domain-containing protein 2 isoform X2 [Cyprinodon tularosa]
MMDPKWDLLLLLLCSNSLRCSAMESVNLVDICGQTIQRDGMIINSHQESKKHYFVTTGTDCHLTMLASSPKEKPTSSSSPDDPCFAGSYLQFYDGRDMRSPPLGPPLCGKTPPKPVLSTGQYLTLRLVTRGTQPRVDFVGDFTSLRLGFNQSECRTEAYFTCRNGNCIPISLVCDDKGIDNCGDGSDLEENLRTGCKGQLMPSELPPEVSSPPLSFIIRPTQHGGTCMNCSGTGSSPRQESVSASSSSLCLLVLYIILATVAAGIILCWCCWSPGWFVWRVSVCRFVPCCKSTCSSCTVCADTKEHRVTKVTPHSPVNQTPMNPTLSTNDNQC